MPYTSPETFDASSIVGLLRYVNEVTGSWFSNMLLISFYVIMIWGYYKVREDLAGAFAVGGFALFVSAFLLFLADFITGITLSICIGLAVLGFVMIAFDKNRGTA